MFLELASIAVEEFSQEFFKKFFGEFVFFFSQEKNQQVACIFARNSLKYREGYVGIPPKDYGS